MTNAAQEAWFAGAAGRSVDIDGVGGFQCVDVPKDYGQTIFGVNWRTLWPGAGNACDMLFTYNPAYFDRIINDPSNPALVPQRGDIIVYAGTKTDAGDGVNPYGHIGAVIDADPTGVLLMDQDGFLQRPMAQDRLGYDNPGTGPCSGWLRPKVTAGAAVSVQSSSITPLGDFLMALSDAEQRALYNNIDYIASAKFKADIFAGTTDVEKVARSSFVDEILSREFPWYGFDGKVPASGRQTTSIKGDIGWSDARTVGVLNSLLAAIKGLAGQIKAAPDAETAATTYDKLVQLIDGTVIALNVQKPAN